MTRGRKPTSLGGPVTRLTAAAVFAASAAAILSLSACGPPEDGGTYDSLNELKAAYTGAGFPCGEWAVDKESSLLAVTSGTCDDGVALALYGEEGEAKLAAVSDRDGGWERSDGPYSLHGLNWSVVGGEIEALAEETGGQLVHRPFQIPVPELPAP